jgi:hypothetical protein
MKSKLSFYNKFRAFLAGNRKYVAIREGDMRTFYASSIQHARSKYDNGGWVIFRVRDLKKML